MSDASRTKGSLIGQTIGGYQVQTLIGRGAMGTVYLARDVKLNRQVALKVLLGSMAQSPALVRQFQLEAQAAAPLKHPCVVRVYSAGIERGTPYMAMEFVDGEPLDRFLRRIGRLKWQQAFHIAAQVALALECAHRNNIVHRDVKPSNIMLDQLGAVRLTDFGIASVQTEDGHSQGHTFVGTPQYMSPEQCTGSKVGPASDLFSLGVTMYQMIAGELPFHGESSMSLIRAICTENPPRLNKLIPSLPDDVARLVAYLLEKKPEMRPANARVVYTLIDRLQEQKGGNSAVGDALTAFLKEEMEARPFANVHNSKTRGPRTHSKSKHSKKRKNSRVSPRVLMRAAIVTFLALGAMSVGPIMSTMAREGGTSKAASVSSGNFRDVGQGVMLAQFFADGYRFDNVSWIAGETAVLVEARGLAGSLTHDAHGLIAFDPIAQRVTSVRSPWGPALNPDYWNLNVPAIVGQTTPKAPANNPLTGAVLVHMRESANGPLLTLGQVWNESTPRPVVLYRDGTEAIARLPSNAEAAGQSSRVLVKPDGLTLCLVQQSKDGGLYLVERDVRRRPLETTGPRLTKFGSPIVATSVQYAPQGQYLAYIRVTPEGGRELWVVHPERGQSDDQRVMSDLASDNFAIRSDGSQIAIEVLDPRTNQRTIRVIDVYGGQVLWELGPGALSPDAWLPSGRQLMIVHADEGDAAGAANQLWIIDVAPPFKRVQLTHLQEGVLPIYAISHDGHWAAAVSGSETFPTLAFVQMSQVGIDNPS